METFERQTLLPVSATEAFDWHERPGALDRLIPPWENVRVEQRSAGIQTGARVVLLNRFGPLNIRWLAEHDLYEPPHRFRDVQIRGPFAQWEHTHRFEAERVAECRLVDHIEYRLPGGWLGSLVGRKLIRQKLARTFAYRQTTTRDDLAAQARYKDRGIMQVAVTGASGLVGSTIVPLLTTAGHGVTPLVRRQAEPGEVTWDPLAASFDALPLEGIDAVVHLAGENIAGRWTDAMKKKIRDSRVKGTRVLCAGLAKMNNPPKTLVCASAIGYYGQRGDELLDENSPPGKGFLPEVCVEWEAACQAARDAGIRVVNLRFGVILSPREAALAKMLTPFKLGLGGKIASGEQYWSWITIDDAAGAIYHALMTSELSGPVNAVAPKTVTNLEFTKTLGKVLRRPTIFPVPAFVARLAFGEMADDLLIGSTRVTPKRLEETGYKFRQPELEGALRHLLGKTE
jgi:uncharacterized protein (TIGR01777 family)